MVRKIALAVAVVFLCCSVNAAAQGPGSYGGFPDVPTSAKPGEFVLVPSYTWIESGANSDKTTFIFYKQQMVAPGAVASRVKFMTPGEREVPNSYIVAIPKGARAKAGDIVLTWWQSGSGMKRAIVMSATDAARPVVRYLDIAYDNPAKSRDKKTGIGQMEEQLEADSFVQLKAGDPGSVFRCGTGDNAERWQLIVSAATGEQLMLGFSGKLKRFTKGECSAMPLKPTAKAGQMASVEMFGRFRKVKIERVDEKIGRVFVLGYDKKERAVAFGDVSP